MSRSFPFHSAHFSIEKCRKMAEELRASKKYLSVTISSHIVVNGEKYAKVFIKPKQSFVSSANASYK